jgi:hypothetical protein
MGAGSSGERGASAVAPAVPPLTLRRGRSARYAIREIRRSNGARVGNPLTFAVRFG